MHNPMSRRSALRTGALAALTASVLSSVTPSLTGASPVPSTLGVPSCDACTSALDEALAEWFAEWSAERQKVGDARDAVDLLVARHPYRLSGLWELCRDACDLHGDQHALDQRFAFEMLCYHLPALAPALRALWQHINEELSGAAIRGDFDAIVGCCQDRRLM